MRTFQQALERPRVAQAHGFAVAKHGDQKYGKDPYSVHLKAVAQLVYTMMPTLTEGWVDTVIAAAFLHDALEDTDATPEEIRGMFGQETLEIVQACTKTEEDLCRRCAFKRTVKSLKDVPFALGVKLADRLANMTKSLGERSPQLKMYVREYPEFRSLLWTEGEYEDFWIELDRVFAAGRDAIK